MTEKRSLSHRLLPDLFLKRLTELTDTDMRLYLTLLGRIRLPSVTTTVSRSELAQAIRRNPRSVSRATSRLESYGLISTRRVDNRRGIKEYTIVLERTSVSPSDKDSTGDTTGDTSPAERQGHKPADSLSKTANDSKKPGSDTGDTPSPVSPSPAGGTTPPPVPPPHNAINILKPTAGREGVTGERNPVSRPIPFKPQNATDLLALDIARTFNDEQHLPTYRFFCDQYDETGVRRAFSEAKSIPDHKIKKSKSALFIYLIRKYAKPKNKNPRH